MLAINHVNPIRARAESCGEHEYAYGARTVHAHCARGVRAGPHAQWARGALARLERLRCERGFAYGVRMVCLRVCVHCVRCARNVQCAICACTVYAPYSVNIQQQTYMNATH